MIVGAASSKTPSTQRQRSWPDSRHARTARERTATSARTSGARGRTSARAGRGELINMAKGKRSHGRRGFRVGKYVNMAFKIMGGVVAASPAIRGIKEHATTPADIPKGVLYHYSGVDLGNVQGGVNQAELIGGIAA